MMKLVKIDKGFMTNNILYTSRTFLWINSMENFFTLLENVALEKSSVTFFSRGIRTLIPLEYRIEFLLSLLIQMYSTIKYPYTLSFNQL